MLAGLDSSAIGGLNSVAAALCLNCGISNEGLNSGARALGLNSGAAAFRRGVGSPALAGPTNCGPIDEVADTGVSTLEYQGFPKTNGLASGFNDSRRSAKDIAASPCANADIEEGMEGSPSSNCPD